MIYVVGFDMLKCCFKICIYAHETYWSVVSFLLFFGMSSSGLISGKCWLLGLVGKYLLLNFFWKNYVEFILFLLYCLIELASEVIWALSFLCGKGFGRFNLLTSNRAILVIHCFLKALIVSVSFSPFCFFISEF